MTTAIVAHFTNGGVPLVAPGNVPTIRIRRTDTGALVATDLAMTELGDGAYRFDFDEVGLLDYSVRADGDPTASGQTTVAERYVFGALDADLVRKVFVNRAETTENSPGPGQKTVDFYNDDQTTIIESIEISADGLSRTNP